MSSCDDEYVIRVRGLPWSATVDEIIQFFDCEVRGGKLGVHMTTSREGRPSGEGYIEMETEDDIDKALKKDKEHMGHRYIEVFKAKRSEMEWVIKRSGMNLQNTVDDGCVRLRGLPFGCSKEEIAQFFAGLEIVPNGITLPTDYQGRSTGEAYVQFASKEVVERALQKHKEKIGHRYIEIFRSSLSEIRATIGSKTRPLGFGGMRPSPYDRGDRFGGANRFAGRGSRPFKDTGGYGDYDDNWSNDNAWGGGGGSIRNSRGGSGGGGPVKGYGGRSNAWSNSSHTVHMRGLPFRATEGDVSEFFHPFSPVNVKLIYDNTGRASGEADVEFGSHDEAVKAMSKDKSNMQHRYIELFLNSAPDSGMGNGNMGSSNMGQGSGGGNFNSMQGGYHGGAVYESGMGSGTFRGASSYNMSSGNQMGGFGGGSNYGAF